MIRFPAGFDGGDRIKRYLDYYQPSYGVTMLSAGTYSPSPPGPTGNGLVWGASNYLIWGSGNYLIWGT